MSWLKDRGVTWREALAVSPMVVLLGMFWLFLWWCIALVVLRVIEAFRAVLS